MPRLPGRDPGAGNLGPDRERREKDPEARDPQMPQGRGRSPPLPAAAALATAAAGPSCAQLVPGCGAGALRSPGWDGQGAGGSRPQGGAAVRSEGRGEERRPLP